MRTVFDRSLTIVTNVRNSCLTEGSPMKALTGSTRLSGPTSRAGACGRRDAMMYWPKRSGSRSPNRCCCARMRWFN